MQILRDLRAFTKILILVELKAQPRSKLRDLASKLDITIQAVSDYLKLMTRENLIVKINGEHRLTQAGVEFLHKNMADLKDFIDSNIKELNLIESCVALAHDDLKKGDEVGLYMEQGLLVAKPIPNKRSKSRGIVLYDARSGDDVAIMDLSGIVEFDYGVLTILELPSTLEGGSREVDLEKLKKIIKTKNPDKLAITDLVGYVVFKKINKRPDIEFSSSTAALEAVQKGLNVLIATSSENTASTITKVEEFNSKTKNKINYSAIPFGTIKKSSAK